jgi:fucose permease
VIERFDIGKTAAGSLLLLNTLGIVVGSVVFGPVVDRWGYKEMLLAAIAIVVVGLEAIALSSSMAWLRVAVLFSGFGGGMLNGGANALVADTSAEGRTAGLSKLAIFFGFGAVGMPLALGSLLGRYSYTTILAGIAALGLVPLAATAVTRFPSPKQAQGLPLASARRLLGDPILLAFGAMLFLESGMEITVGGWTSTFVKDELQVGDRNALVYLSLYWLGMMVGRTTLGFTLRRFAPTRILLSCLTIGLVASLVVIATHDPAVAAIAIFSLGVGHSATFPLVLGFVADRYSALSGTAFSVVMVMALTGGMILPYLTGALGASYGLRASLLIVPTALVSLAAILGIASSHISAAEAGPA